MRDFASLGLWPFPTPSFICLSENYSNTIWGKLVGFSSFKDVDFIQCNLKSVSIFSYYWLFLGKKHIESTMLCYGFAKHVRFCEPGVVTFPDDISNFFVGELVENNCGENWWGSRQLRMLTLFSVIWSQIQFLVIDYSLGKNIYSLCSDPTGTGVANRYGSRTMLPTLYTSQLSLAVLVRWPIRAL